MIIVNNLRVWATPLLPAVGARPWNGCTLADLIFPFFLFIVGVSTVFSLDQRVQTGESRLQMYRHILIRTTILFLLGLLACSYFFFGWLFQAICPPEGTQRACGRYSSPLLPTPRSGFFPWPTCGFPECSSGLHSSTWRWGS